MGFQMSNRYRILSMAATKSHAVPNHFQQFWPFCFTILTILSNTQRVKIRIIALFKCQTCSSIFTGGIDIRYKVRINLKGLKLFVYRRPKLNKKSLINRYLYNPTIFADIIFLFYGFLPHCRNNFCQHDQMCRRAVKSSLKYMMNEFMFWLLCIYWSRLVRFMSFLNILDLSIFPHLTFDAVLYVARCQAGLTMFKATDLARIRFSHTHANLQKTSVKCISITVIKRQLRLKKY